jgi:hypothetical protein
LKHKSKKTLTAFYNFGAIVETNQYSFEHAIVQFPEAKVILYNYNEFSSPNFDNLIYLAELGLEYTFLVDFRTKVYTSNQAPRDNYEVMFYYQSRRYLHTFNTSEGALFDDHYKECLNSRINVNKQQIQCSSCKYYNKSGFLPCAVNPKFRINVAPCRDYMLLGCP